MKTFLQVLKKPTSSRERLVRAFLMLLAGLVILPAAAQFNGSDNYIFISGQLTNNVNGAPISDHDIYITSDSTSGSGFQHYAIVKTDINGFYRDTVVTTQTDGAMVIYLYDFYNNIKEDTAYFRFTWSDNYQMIANFEIHDPNATQTLQANFVAEEDTVTGDELSVTFRDMTYGYKVKAWHWDFGDGNTSEIQDPDHTYAEPGIYLVTLTVSAYPPAYEYFQTSTIVKQVEVGRTSEYHLGGHVFTGLYPPIDVGYAYLYLITEDEQYIPIDTAVIDTLGYYYFMQLLEGKYVTKARLDEGSSFYGQYIPTYLGNVLAWDQAEKITLNQTNWECDINLIPSDGIPMGKGTINGQMLYDTSLVNNPLVPAGDIEVVLLGVEGTHITCKVSDLQGDFEFPELAYGTYQLFPDVAGVPVTSVFITISEENPVADDFSLVISKQNVTYLGINDPEQSKGMITGLYPNPATDWVNLNIEMKSTALAEIMIIDPSGRCAFRQSTRLTEGGQHLELDVSRLSAGIYQLVVATGGSTVSATKLIIAE